MSENHLIQKQFKKSENNFYRLNLKLGNRNTF